MYTTNDIKRLVGLAWDEFFRLVDHHQATKQSVSMPLEPKCNEDVAMLPHKKATCYGFCSVTESPKLVKCQNCGLVIKTVAFGHHQKIHHSHFCSPIRRSVSSDSDSDDDCQGFLLSPPHNPTLTVPSSSETMFDLKFVEETKWTISDSLKSHTTADGRNAKDWKDGKTLRQSPPRYDVQRRNDLRLVLTKRRSPITRTRKHQTGDFSPNQAPSLVSISFTRSSGQKQNVQITDHKLTPKQRMNKEKTKRNGTFHLNANERCNKRAEWPNVQLTDDHCLADLEESEQSSIPLHHSPSESSDSDIEGNDQQCIETGGELPAESYDGWNPQKAAERPSKSNNMQLRHKVQQKKDMTAQQQNNDSREREHKMTDGEGRNRQTEKSPANSGMDVVVEKLFKIQGISVMALSSDGKRTLAIPKQKHIPPNSQRGESGEIGTDSHSQNVHYFIGKGNVNAQNGSLFSLGHRPHDSHSDLSSQRRKEATSVPSPSLSDDSLQILNTITADESNESQKSEGNSRADSQSFGTFFGKQQTTQHKTPPAFAGVNWHKLGPQSGAVTHCPQNVPKMPNANSRKGTLRFVPFNSANESAVEQRLENNSKRMEKTTQIREETSVGHSSAKFTEAYDGHVRHNESDLRNSKFGCHFRQNVVHSSPIGSPNSASAAFFGGQKSIRKRSFIQQPKANQQIHQQQIAAKRFRPIAPRKSEETVRICNVDNEFGPFSVQSRGFAAAVSQHQPPNSPCRVSHPPQTDQRFHPKILSGFPPASSVAPFADSALGHAAQLSPSADFRTFARQPRHLFSVKQYQQSHPTHQLRGAQLSPFETFGDVQRHPQLYDAHAQQTDGVHGHGSAGLIAQRIPSEYSHAQMGKTATPCAHLHQCQPYGTSVGTPLAVPCSSAFLFAASPPVHPPPSSLSGPFPSVRQMPESLPPSQQQHLLLHQQHFHPLSVLPSPQCRHNFAHPSPSSVSSSMHGHFSVCRGAPFAGMASPPTESLFLPPTLQQCQQQQIPHRFLRGQQQQRHTRVATYDNEMDLEISIEPPPVLEAEGNISTSEEGPLRFDGGGGGTERSDSDASDMDLREILPQQQ